ncbi:MAG TPA: N,N-dimethylformamidase beta subunit family domain-containing protein [Polyangia bacterium]|nr:N,N-dimethylformamidase beta subunit family domain-containing protein [Polyangia bacterium]
MRGPGVLFVSLLLAGCGANSDNVDGARGGGGPDDGGAARDFSTGGDAGAGLNGGDAGASLDGGARDATSVTATDLAGPPRPSPIAAENLLAGDPGWRLTAPSSGVAGFADRVSYAPGDTITVHAAASAATTATWELWRLGYYNGDGGRRVASGGPVNLPAAAPAQIDPTTGAVSAPWAASFTIALDPQAVTGVYLVKLIAPASQSYVLAVVREPSPAAPILYPVAVDTYQAYNAWGGTSLYDNLRSDWSASHAYAVSFDRPYAQGNGAGQLFNVDRDFITFVEAQGYDLAYATDADLDADASLASWRRLVVLEGHSEYWTANMRSNLEAALAAGVNLAFFGANDCYWQVRWASNARRTLIGYKDYAALDPAQANDPAHVTTRWRDPPLSQPENALLGVEFGQWIWTASPFVPADATHWLWTGSGMTAGAMVPGLYGFEIDSRQANGAEPAGLTEIGGALVENHNGVYGRGAATLYTAPSGAQVFASGTVPWANALAGPGAWDRRVQIATANLFSRFAGDGTLGASLLANLSLPPGPQPYDYRAGVQVSTVTSALANPVALAVAPGGDAIVVDDNRLVRVSAAGAVTLIAGGQAGDQDGTGAAAAFNGPRGVAVAGDGTIYVADTNNHKIKRVTPAGVVTTLAGSVEGYAEGTGAAARFDTPMAIAMMPSGSLLVVDTWNNRMRAVTTSGTTSCIAGDGKRNLLDGPALKAELYFPIALTVMPDGSVVWPEAETGLVRVMGTDAQRTVSTYAGELGRIGWQDGPASTASVSEIISVTARPNGELLLLDTAAYRVRSLAGSTISTVAGGARQDLFDGAGSAAGFSMPRAAAVALDGSVLVADSGNHALRRITIP